MAAYTPTVSRHAIARYRERVQPATNEEIRCRILTPMVCAALAAGANRIRGVGGITIIADKGRVVTVIPADWEARAPGAGYAKRDN